MYNIRLKKKLIFNILSSEIKNSLILKEEILLNTFFIYFIDIYIFIYKVENIYKEAR